MPSTTTTTNLTKVKDLLSTIKYSNDNPMVPPDLGDAPTKEYQKSILGEIFYGASKYESAEDQREFIGQCLREYKLSGNVFDPEHCQPFQSLALDGGDMVLLGFSGVGSDPDDNKKPSAKKKRKLDQVGSDPVAAEDAEDDGKKPAAEKDDDSAKDDSGGGRFIFYRCMSYIFILLHTNYIIIISL